MERPKRSRALVMSVTGSKSRSDVPQGRPWCYFRVHSAAREISHAQIRRHIAAGGGRGSDHGAHCRRSARRTAGRPNSVAARPPQRLPRGLPEEHQRIQARARKGGRDIPRAFAIARFQMARLQSGTRKAICVGRSLCRGTRRHIVRDLGSETGARMRSTGQVMHRFLANHVPRAHSTLVSAQREGPLAGELRRSSSTSIPRRDESSAGRRGKSRRSGPPGRRNVRDKFPARGHSFSPQIELVCPRFFGADLTRMTRF